MSPLNSTPVRIIKLVLSAMLGAAVGIFLDYILSKESAAVKFDLWLEVNHTWWIWGLAGGVVAVAVVQFFTMIGRRASR